MSNEAIVLPRAIVAKSKEMTPVIRAQIVALYGEGIKATAIAETVGFFRASVYYTINNFF